MNSHIVEKTMHSIKNIDRLTDLAAIDVYNTTHDTINKYEIMKEHATEEYTNESFYQESVLAGVLIGAGVLGVAISAFFIIKKIIDSKDSADSSVKSADGKMVAAQVDLSDPKSTEKYLTDLKARLEKLTETKSIKVTKSINKDEFEAAEKKINTWSEQLQEMIDNKHEAAEIEKIIDGMDISSVDVSKIFVNNEVDASVADFAEALGLRSISSFASLLSSLKKKINDVEKMVNNKKDKEAENAVQISQDHLTKLKNQNNDAAKLIAALKAQSTETLNETDKAVLGAINAETEAKKKTEEPKTEEKHAGDGAAENKTETTAGENKTDAQSSADDGSGAGGGDNTGKKSSTLENVMGPGGQTEQMQQAADAKQAAQNKDVLYLNPKEDTQKDAAGKQVIPAAAEAKANEKTLEDVINMIKGGKSEEEIRGQLALNNYKADQIDAFLTEAKNKIANERKSELLNQTLGGTKPKALAGEVLPPETEAKPFKFPKAEDSTFSNNRREQGIDKVVENIRRLVPADSEEGSWDKIVPTLKTYGFTDDEINDYAVKNNIIPSESQDTLRKAKILEYLRLIKTEESRAKKFIDELYNDDFNGDLAKYTERAYQGAANEGQRNGVYVFMKDLAQAIGENPNDIPKPTQTAEPEGLGDNNPLNPPAPPSNEPKTTESSDETKTEAKGEPSTVEEPEKKPEDQVKTEPENSPAPTDQNTGENAQETTPETSTEEPETKPEGEDKNPPAGEGSEDTNGIPYNVLSAEYLQSLLNMPEQSAIEAIKNLKDEDIERMTMGIPKNIFVQLFENAASALATISPATYSQQLTDMLNNNAAVNKIKALLYQIKQGDRTALPKLKTTNFKELAELTDGRDVSDYITSILPRVKSAFDSLVAKYEPAVLDKKSKVWGFIANIEQNAATFFNKIKEACEGLSNKDKALAKVNELEAVVEEKMHHLDPNYSGKIEGLPNYGSNGKSINIGGHTSNGQVSGSIGKAPENEIERQQRQVESLLNNKIQAPAQFNPSAPADWNDRMNELGKAGIPNKQVPEPKTAPTPLNPAAPTEWNDNMNALKSAGAENISQKTEVPPIAPIDTNADIEKAKAEKAQLDALQQHRQEQLAQLKAERAQREQQVRDAYAQDAQARQNAVNEELAKQSQEDEQKKAQANELTNANEEANVAEAIRQAEEEKKALEEGKNLSVSPQSTEGLDNAAKIVAMQDFIKNFKDPAWREAHPGIVSWQGLYDSEGYKNEAIMKVEADRIKNEKLADNRAGIQFIKEQNYEAIVPSLNKALETTSDAKTITRYLDGLKTAYAKILMQYQQNPGNARKIIEDYSKDGAAPYEFYAVPYNELNQTQLIDWQQRLFNEKVELDKDRRRNRKKIKAVDKIIDKLIELDELLKTSVHNVIAAATKNPMRALEAALVMFQEGDEEIVAGLTAIENFINKADEVKASEEEADNTPENPAEEPSDEEVSQSILSILKS